MSEAPRLKRAIVRPPSPSIVDGLTDSDLGAVQFELALEQHEAYCRALSECGLELIYLDPVIELPDSTFVEDTAVVGTDWAISTRPGAQSRRKEAALMKPVLRRHFTKTAAIESPGTLDGGDVLGVGNRFYIGISRRTNSSGAHQLLHYLENYGSTGETVPVDGGLHLKTGLSFLAPNLILCTQAYASHPSLETFEKLIVPEAEAYAANVLEINGTVLVPAGFPLTLNSLKVRGYVVKELEMSEFRKVDGGLSCLSLRF